MLHNTQFAPAGNPEHPEHDNIFTPQHWGLGWLDGTTFPGIDPGATAQRPEANIINEWQGLNPDFFPHDSYTFKLFVRQGLFAWLYPVQERSQRDDPVVPTPVNLPAGTYRAWVEVWPKLHLLNEGNTQPGDPWAGEVGFALDGMDIDNIDWRSHLQYDRYNLLEWYFDHDGGEVLPYWFVKGKYPIDNSFFFHRVGLETMNGPIPIDPPPTPPPTPPPPPAPGPGRVEHVYSIDAELMARLDRFLDIMQAAFEPVPAPVPSPPSPPPTPPAPPLPSEPVPPKAAGALLTWSQNDPRWANEVYAGNTTFRTAGCLVCAFCSIASLAYAEAPTPPEFAAQLRSVGAFNGALLSHPDRIPNAYNLLALDGNGFLHWRNSSADLDYLAQYVEDHGACVVEVKWDPASEVLPQNGNQHFVTVIDVYADADDVLIADPWDGEIKRLSQSRYVGSEGGAGRWIYGARLLRPNLQS